MWFNHTGYHIDISRRNTNMNPKGAAPYLYFSIFDHPGVIYSCAWLYVIGVVSDPVKERVKALKGSILSNRAYASTSETTSDSCQW